MKTKQFGLCILPAKPGGTGFQKKTNDKSNCCCLIRNSEVYKIIFEVWNEVKLKVDDLFSDVDDSEEETCYMK